MTIEGLPNQLYSQGMQAYQQWDEMIKFFALVLKRDKVTDQVVKDLLFTEMNLGKYLTKHYALWLDLRTTNDNSRHGAGRVVLNTIEGITIKITKTKTRISLNFKYLSLYNTRYIDRFQRGIIQRSSLFSFQDVPTMHLFVVKLAVERREEPKRRITIANPITPGGREMLQELLRMFFNKYAGSPTLYIIDNCSAMKELTKKKDMLSQQAFSGRHAEQ